jgi:DNA-directed RNA polymerase subunit L
MPAYTLRLTGGAATGMGNAIAHELMRKNACDFAAFQMPHPQDTSSCVVMSAPTLESAVDATVDACGALIARLDALLDSLPVRSHGRDDAVVADAEACAPPGITDASLEARQITRRQHAAL